MKRLIVCFFFCLFVAAVRLQAAVEISRVDYQGWKDCYKISNGVVEMIACPQAGGRIVHFAKAGQASVIMLNPETVGKTAPPRLKPEDGPIWHPWGAFMWLAPNTDGSFLFNEPYRAESKNRKLIMTGQPVAYTGTQKRIEIEMSRTRPEVRLDYFLTNVSDKPARYGIWCSLMAPNRGTSFMPVARKSRFENGFKEFSPLGSGQIFRTDEHLVLKRLPDFGASLTVATDAEQGWLAYFLDGNLLLKTFPVYPGREYYNQVNTQVYTDQNFTELESLSPIYEIKPGQTVSFWEKWYLF